MTGTAQSPGALAQLICHSHDGPPGPSPRWFRRARSAGADSRSFACGPGAPRGRAKHPGVRGLCQILGCAAAAVLALAAAVPALAAPPGDAAAPDQAEAPTAVVSPAPAPAGSFRVLIDAGHGGSDPGAIQTNPALAEKDITLRLALLLGAALQRRGIAVAYTRADDRFVSLDDRAAAAQRDGAQALVSLHLNAAPDPAASGAEVWYGNGSRDADLAAVLLDALAGTLRQNGIPVRGTRFGPELAVLHAPVPAALVEVGYLSNSSEARVLNNTAFLGAAAEALADGLVRFRSGAPLPARRLALTLPSGNYTVAPGDTLSAIASAVGASILDLVHLNGLATPDLILAGQILHVRPGGAVSAPAPVPAAPVTSPSAPPSAPTGEPATYVVAPGDTLGAIAIRFGRSAADLAAWNGLADPGLVRAGQTLRVSPPPAGAVTPARPANSPAARRYQVRPGDTLSDIAVRLGVSLDALRRANALADPDRVLAGATLAIPTP